MAFARLSAAGSLLIASGLAILVPNVRGVGLAALVGWAAVVVLAVGLGTGESTAVVLATTLFIVRIAMLAVLPAQVFPPPWIQAVMLVLIVELGALSLETRVRPRPVVIAVSGAGVSAVVATAVALVMESAVYGTESGGVLIRVAAIAALVLAGGWIMSLWHRTVVSTRDQ